MSKKNGANAPRGSAWPEKPIELLGNEYTIGCLLALVSLHWLAEVSA
ncbi:hypothetical protein PS647_03760 [Pseudomonas fluorescens]|nr:hypothetical protein [Pseudomonas fluorescens]VVN09359.1 hypothetical protein PS647_03760 [Pseudomonas fluorescens]